MQISHLSLTPTYQTARFAAQEKEHVTSVVPDSTLDLTLDVPSFHQKAGHKALKEFSGLGGVELATLHQFLDRRAKGDPYPQ